MKNVPGFIMETGDVCQLDHFIRRSTSVTSAQRIDLLVHRQHHLHPGMGQVLLRSCDVESILMMVAAEVGISVLPVSCMRHLSDADNVVFAPMEGKNEVEEILAVWRKDNESPSLRHFLKLMDYE